MKKTLIPPVTATDRARFMAKVQVQPDGCWLWTGSQFTNGYGAFSLGGREGSTRRAHRVIYVWTYGEYEQEHLHHRCDVRLCVNPAHLEPLVPGPHLAEHGNGPQTHCKNGHSLSGDNLYVPPGQPTWKQCRTCKGARAHAAHPGQNNRDKTHCKNGHEFTEANTLRQKSGRMCKTCQRAAQRAYDSRRARA